jgi:hypothetical protein
MLTFYYTGSHCNEIFSDAPIAIAILNNPKNNSSTINNTANIGRCIIKIVNPIYNLFYHPKIKSFLNKLILLLFAKVIGIRIWYSVGVRGLVLL